MTTMSKIKIKRSTTAGAPGTTLDAGELAYSGLSGTQSNGGDRLYIGINSTQVTIGGKYFTDMLDHVTGTLTASSAILVDSNKKVDQLRTTNLDFGGAGFENSITATNSNGGIYLQPDGTGNVHISGEYYLPNVDGAADYVLTSHNDGTTSWELPATALTVAGDTGTNLDIDLLNDTLLIEGDDTSGVDTTTNPSLNKITISMKNASDTQKGVATFKNTDFTVTAGDVELAVNVPQEFTADSGSTLTLTGNSLLIEGDSTLGIETSTGTNKIHIQNKKATSAQLGVAKFSTSHFTVTDGNVVANLATTTDDGVAHFPTAQFTVSNGGVEIRQATTSQEGVAKFDTINFDMSTPGKVVAKAIYLGSTILELGDATGTNKDLAGMDTIQVGDLRFENNQIGFNSGAAANRDLILAPNGTGLVKISNTWTLPSGAGTNGYALLTNGSNSASWTEIGKSLTYKDDAGQTGEIDFLTEEFAILGDVVTNAGAITTTTTDTNGFPQIKISARTATNLRTGISSFSSDSFDVSVGGAVTIKALGVTNAQLVNDSITFGSSEYFLGGNGAADDGYMDFVGMDYAEFSNIVIGLSGDTNVTGSEANTIRATSGNLKLVAAGAVQINNSTGSFTLPTGRGTADYVLQTDGSGGTSWAQISTNLNIAGDNATSDGFNLINDTLTFVGDDTSGLTVEVSDGSYVTFTVDDAAAGVGSAQKGTASFESADFTSTAGHITLDNSVVKKVKADSGTDVVTSGHELSVLGTSARGITTAATANTITVSADYAGYNTGAHLGVASFDDVGFTVSNGAVTANSIFLGTTELNLGDDISTNTIVEGLTDVTIGDLQIHSSNTIESVASGANANIYLLPKGTGTVDVSSKRITNVATPTDGYDAVNKSYADALVSGLDVKNSVRVIAKSNITLSGTQTIDGVALIADDRVLVAGQTTASQNGIYDVKAGAWVRSADADNSPAGEVTSGLFTFVEEGTTWANSGFILVTANPITLGTTALAFTQFSAAGQTIAGDGLTKSGDAINVVGATNGGIKVNGDSIELESTLAGNGLTYTSGVLAIVGTTDRITVNANDIDIASTYEGQTSIIKLGTVTTGTWAATVISPTHGGTGFETYTKGNILYSDATNSLAKLSIGTEYQFLMVDPVSGTPVWSDIDGGTY
jgi:hypothetical protein